MAGFFYKGILLQQRKEPALSRDLQEFINADTMGLRMDCPPVEHPETLTSGEILAFARMAGVVDERDGVPLADKLEKARDAGARLVIVDAVDDEPYISSQLNPVLKNLQLAADGLSFCQRACGASQAYFAIYKNLTDLDLRIPRHIGNFTVMRLHGRYPAEYQASQDYAEDGEVLVVGSGAILHLARAILFRKPQNTTFVTVAGDCVGTPTNLEVSLGMTVTQTLERCGLIDDPHRVVVGGSMTGISVMDTDRTLVTHTTRAILAFRQDLKTLGLSCIGCVRCVHVCPEGLNPFYLYNSIKQKRFDMFRGLDAQMCVGCGTCSYMCPAKLDLSETIYQAASGFRPHLAAMRATAALDKKRDAADYRRFYDDYLLGKAVSAHRWVRWKLAREFRGACREAVAARRAADKKADRDLRQARKTLATARRMAEATLAAAKQQLDAVIEKVDRSVSDQQAQLIRITREAKRTLRASRLSGNTAEAAARQNLLAILLEQRRFASAVARAAKNRALRLEKSAAAAEIPIIRQELESLIARAEARRTRACQQAQACAVHALDHARAAFDNAARFCHQRIADGEKALAQVQQDAEAEKEAALRSYEEAQAAFDAAIQEAEAAFAKARDAAAAQKEKAAKIWAQATKDIRPKAAETLREADQALVKARETALASALASGEADAAVTGRALRLSDIRPPVHLTNCETELLRGQQLLAFAPVIEQGQATRNVEKLLLEWTGPLSQKVPEKHGEEVLS